MHDSTFDYLKPTPDQLETMQVLRINFKIMCEKLERMIPDGRYKSLAVTALEESAMWANKGVTRSSDGTPITADNRPIVVEHDLSCRSPYAHNVHGWSADGKNYHCPGRSQSTS